jgi:hypothetical protein
VIAVTFFWQSGSSRRRSDNELLTNYMATAFSDDDAFDADSVSPDMLTDSDLASLSVLDQQLVESSDIDDLFDDLTSSEQAKLLQALQGLYGRHDGG